MEDKAILKEREDAYRDKKSRIFGISFYKSTGIRVQMLSIFHIFITLFFTLFLMK
jgi:hypothetical protein